MSFLAECGVSRRLVSSGVLPRMGLDATISLEMKPQKPNPDPESENANAKRVIK